MVQFTVEETNLMSIYHEGGKAQLMENMTAALPDMTRICGSLQSAPFPKWTL